MSSIGLYNLFRRILDTTGAEAQAAVDSIPRADTVATKADIVELKTDIAVLKTDIATLKVDVAELKTDLIKWVVIANGIMVVILSLILKL